MTAAMWGWLTLAMAVNIAIAFVVAFFAHRGVFQLWHTEGFSKPNGFDIGDLTTFALQDTTRKIVIATPTGMKLATSIYIARLGQSQVIIIEPEGLSGA